MFDTPDLMPVCLAPFIAGIVGIAVYAISSTISTMIEKRSGHKPDWLRRTVLIISIGSVPIACIASVALGIGVRDPAPWFKPSDQSIIGTYQLNPNDRYVFTLPDHELVFDEHYVFTLPEHEIVFSDDHTFHASNVPELWELTGEWDASQLKYMSGSGTWHIDLDDDPDQKEWILVARFDTVNGEADNRTMKFYFEGHFPPYMLIYLDNGVSRFVKQ